MITGGNTIRYCTELMFDLLSFYIQAYHSSLGEKNASLQTVGNMALLPLRTQFRGPALAECKDDMDVIDEAIYYFRANVFFRFYEIKVQNIYYYLVYLF